MKDCLQYNLVYDLLYENQLKHVSKGIVRESKSVKIRRLNVLDDLFCSWNKILKMFLEKIVG